ncbi:MAG: GLUG motif-containing protein [Balneolales bacterium]
MTQLVLSILIIGFANFADQGQFSGGSGTIMDPYEIATLEQLQEIHNHTSEHFIQISDIDASDADNLNEGHGFIPIGNGKDLFTGTFDGNNFHISNLSIHREKEDTVGLFGKVDKGAVIKNVTLVEVTVEGNNRVGGLIGSNQGEVQNSSVEGNISGNHSVGGLIGSNSGTIQASCTRGRVISHGDWVGGLIGSNSGAIYDSCSEADVSGNDAIGGLIGINSGAVHDSYTTGQVQGSAGVGGLIGSNEGDIQDSYAEGEITGFSFFIGGLIGRNRGGDVRNSYALGYIMGPSEVGGLIGTGTGNSAVSNSYALGNVYGRREIGGFIGLMEGNSIVSNSYSAGYVSGRSNVGGFAGLKEAAIASSYWDMISSGQSNGIGTGDSDGLTGLITEEMTGDTAVHSMNEIDFNDVWIVVEGSGHVSYPFLQSNQQDPPPLFVFPPVVELLMPEDKAGHVEIAPVFKWTKAGTFVTYQFQIATDSDFQERVADSAGIRKTEFHFPDSLDHSMIYFWRIRGVNILGTGDWSDVYSFTTALPAGVEPGTIPVPFTLKQNYPNPFNPATLIRFAIPEPAHVQLVVYNTIGQRITTLVDDIRSEGWHEATFDAAGLSSGLYLYRIEAGVHAETRHMMLLK